MNRHVPEEDDMSLNQRPNFTSSLRLEQAVH